MPTVEERWVSRVDETALLTALMAVKKGDFAVRLPIEWTGVAGKVADAFNEAIELNERLAKELERLRRGVGKDGKINQRASLGDVGGCWTESISSVNSLIDDLVHPTSAPTRLLRAVSHGQHSQTIALE